MIKRALELSNGQLMPVIGLGTYQVTTQEVINTAVDAALSAGYRHIDTASVYRNEHLIGEALSVLLPKHKLKRTDIYLTSKVGPKLQGNKTAIEECVSQSLKNLRTNYLDLCLIHWPGTQKLEVNDPLNRSNRLVTWRTLEQLYKQGLLKAIGVSNYTIKHLQEIEESDCILPLVNQVEVHPHYPQCPLLSFCSSKGITVQAYSSLGTSNSKKSLLSDTTIRTVSEETGLSVAQVLLVWGLRQGLVVLPKSTNPDHIRSNYQSLDLTLSDHHIETLSSIGVESKYAWNPESVL